MARLHKRGIKKYLTITVGMKSEKTYPIPQNNLVESVHGVTMLVPATDGTVNSYFYPWHRVRSISWSGED